MTVTLLKEKCKALLFSFALVLPAAGYSATPDFASEPLFVGTAVSPNLLFILDDSGSMQYEYMPDSLNGYGGVGNGACVKYNKKGNCKQYANPTGEDAYYYAYYSPKINKVYYNPETVYQVPFARDGSGKLQESSYTAASPDGYYTYSYSRNLSDNGFYSNGTTFKSGFYFSYDAGNNGCGSNIYDNDCYDYVDVNSLSSEQKTNFANWYSFYRSRMKAAKAGIGIAFNGLSEDFRLGWGAINQGKNNVDGAYVRAVKQGVRQYTSSHRKGFYNWLYAESGNSGTPLLRALEGAGSYYEKSAASWRDEPGEPMNASNPARECRKSYTILMTDGYYNTGNGYDADSDLDKADDKNGSVINNPKGESYQYKPVNPFTDNRNGSATLADIAMYYWKRDLQAGLNNFVAPSTKNPAFWQHMVTYGVGLGVTGTVNPETAFNAVASGSSIDWWGGNSDEDKINDLLHAGVNSRGGFFSADNPEEFATALIGTLDELNAEAGTSTAVEFDVSSFQEGALIFSAQFDPNGWTGDLRALKLEGTDSPTVPDAQTAIENGNGWSAKMILDSRDLATNDRSIMTYTGGKGVPFRWADLDTDQKSDLSYGGNASLGQQVLSFIRGDVSNEGNGTFRDRKSRLGDIINSSPEYVGAAKAAWPDEAPFGDTTSRYSDFASAHESRSPVVFVGSNDGMLHGFSATESGGQELFGYIPDFVYSTSSGAGLHYLADPDYKHRYYVDLSTRQQDVYTKGRTAAGGVTANRAWRSLLVGGGRTGAKGIYAIDVTDPGVYSEANAAKTIMWEFSAEDDARLGYVTQPPIVSMAKWGAGDARWTAFVANGYGSGTASTGFFMLDIEGGLDGSWDAGDIRYIQFKSGGDGLSPLTVLDTTGDYLSDRVYAGDLDGSLWAANVDINGNWASSYTSGGMPEPLFKSPSSQAITAEPKVAAHPDQPRAGNLPNLMVYVGTGKYLEKSDISSTATQSVYGVWDRGESGLTRSNLVPRGLTQNAININGQETQARYSNGQDVDYTGTHRGWYVDLTDSGERVTVSAQIRGEFLFLNTMVPDVDPCKSGGSGWLMAFGLDGRTPEKQAFVTLPVLAGYKLDGLPNQSTILGTYRFTSTTDDKVDVTEIAPLSGSVAGAGRRGWQELIE